MKRSILLLIALLVLGSCSNEKKEIELQNKISELETQLDECLNGAEKLLGKIKVSFEKRDFYSVKQIYSEFEKKHPGTSEFNEAKSLYEQVIQVEAEERIQAEKLAEEKRKEQEKIRIEQERKIEQEKQEKLKALKKLKKEHDDISGNTWYYQPYFTHYNNRNLISIYMGDNGYSRWLRLKMSYNGDNWIFFENAYLSYEGNTKTIYFNEYQDKKSDNSGGSVWEWIDVSVTTDIESFLREFAKSKDAKMRLSGKYTKTRNLTGNERQGILDVLNGYDALEKGLK